MPPAMKALEARPCQSFVLLLGGGSAAAPTQLLSTLWYPDSCVDCVRGVEDSQLGASGIRALGLPESAVQAPDGVAANADRVRLGVRGRGGYSGPPTSFLVKKWERQQKTDKKEGNMRRELSVREAADGEGRLYPMSRLCAR